MTLKILHHFKFTSQLIRKFSSETKLVTTAVNEKTGVVTVNLNRPTVNNLNLELLSDISSTLTALEKSKCRGLILTSTSKTAFSAGLDVSEMYKPNLDRAKKFWTALQDTWLKLYGSSYPTVAVINGHAPAGGCLITLGCEYRVMLKGYTIGLNETLLGVVAPPWFIDSMRNVIGQRQAELALTTGRLFTTDEALNVGLVDEIVESKEEGIAKGEAFLSKFAKIPPLAQDGTKKLVREETINRFVQYRENDLEDFIQRISNPQMQKQLGMFLEALKKKSGAS